MYVELRDGRGEGGGAQLAGRAAGAALLLLVHARGTKGSGSMYMSNGEEEEEEEEEGNESNEAGCFYHVQWWDAGRRSNTALLRWLRGRAGGQH